MSFYCTRTDVIGQGAYGIVYRGRQEESGDQVAIKKIPFADSTPEGGVPCNVIREISLLRELDHPNVVKLLDIIQAAPGGLYLVFEYVSHDLKTFMDQHQRSEDISERVGLPLQTVRSFLRQIIAGVGCCHTYRILHRDLKPHNVSWLSMSNHGSLSIFSALLLLYFIRNETLIPIYSSLSRVMVNKSSWQILVWRGCLPFPTDHIRSKL